MKDFERMSSPQLGAELAIAIDNMIRDASEQVNADRALEMGFLVAEVLRRLVSAARAHGADSAPLHNDAAAPEARSLHTYAAGPPEELAIPRRVYWFLRGVGDSTISPVPNLWPDSVFIALRDDVRAFLEHWDERDVEAQARSPIDA